MYKLHFLLTLSCLFLSLQICSQEEAPQEEAPAKEDAKKSLIVLPLEVRGVSSVAEDQIQKALIKVSRQQEDYETSLGHDKFLKNEEIEAYALKVKVERAKKGYNFKGDIFDLKRKRKISTLRLSSISELKLIRRVTEAIAALFDLQLRKKVIERENKKKKVSALDNEDDIQDSKDIDELKKIIAAIKKIIKNNSSKYKKSQEVAKNSNEGKDNKNNKNEEASNSTSKGKGIVSKTKNPIKPKTNRPLVFRKKHFASIQYVRDAVESKTSIFETANSFNKMLLRYNMNLFYDDIAAVGVRGGVVLSRNMNPDPYELPMNYEASLGIETFPSYLPFSIFVKANYEKYSYVSLPEFGSGLQETDTNLLWMSAGFSFEFFANIKKLWIFNVFRNNRLEFEIGESLSADAEFKSSGSYQGNLTGNFLRVSYLTSIYKKYFLGAFLSRYNLVGDRDNFEVSSNVLGLNLAYAF